MTLFPYTTLFRSGVEGQGLGHVVADGDMAEGGGRGWDWLGVGEGVGAGGGGGRGGGHGGGAR